MRKTLLALAAAVCLVPALSFAAQPAKNTSFAACDKTNPDDCDVRFKTNSRGTKLTTLAMYNQCSRLPPRDGTYPKVRVNDEGKFNKSGTVTNVVGQEVDWAIKGKFRKPRKAVGTFELDGRGCDSDPAEFVARPVE